MLRRVLAVSFSAVAIPIAQASWLPLSLHRFRDGTGADEADGRGHFRHTEEHRLDGGGSLSLAWHVETDPRELLSVDAEHLSGLRILECRSIPTGGGRDSSFPSAQLRLLLPREHLEASRRWKHIVASRALHGCPHLGGEHMYTRLRERQATVAHLEGVVATFLVDELPSASHVLPRSSFYFSYAPAEAADVSLSKHPRPKAGWNTVQRRAAARARAAGAGAGAGAAAPVSGRRLGEAAEPGKPFGGDSDMFDFVPREVGNFGWNWDYEANSTKDEQFSLQSTGFEGYAKFEKPAVRAHAKFTLNFSSHEVGFGIAPEEHIVATLDGHGFISGDFTGILKADDAYSDDLMRQFRVPLLNGMEETTYLTPLEFYLGSVPVKVSPGIRMNINAYHIGRFKGSMRIGLETHLKFNVTLDFHSTTGLKSRVNTDLVDVKLDPPTWLVYTRHFEMGAMLEPEFWLRGSMGDVKDMKMDLDARPYFNVSIAQKGMATSEHSLTDLKYLAIFPFRVHGLPIGEEFSLQLKSNGKVVNTSNQLSFGVIEFSDDVEKFDFGFISEDEFLSNAVEVSILRHGVVLAHTEFYCQALVDGECSPTPTQAILKLKDGGFDHDVVVQMSILWQDQPLTVLTEKTRSLSVNLPDIHVLPDMALKYKLQQPAHEKTSKRDDKDKHVGSQHHKAPTVEFQILRNGRAYSTPLVINNTDPKHLTLHSSVDYQLGNCFLDSWMSHGPHDLAQGITPRLELLVDGQVVASTLMPPIAWNHGNVFKKKTHWRMFEDKTAPGLGDLHGVIPLDFALREPAGTGHVVGTGQLHFTVEDPSQAAFWIWPSQAERLTEIRQRQLIWTVPVPRDQKVDWTLWAMKVNKKGEFAPLVMLEEFSASCDELQDIVGEEHKDELSDADATLQHVCAFRSSLKDRIAEHLIGHRIVFMVQWTRGGRMNEMLSQPIDFDVDEEKITKKAKHEHRNHEKHGSSDHDHSEHAERRLNLLSPGTIRSNLVGRGFGLETSDIDFAKKMKELNPTCDQRPLEYSIGFGVFTRERVQHVIMQSEDVPDYDSGWLEASGSENDGELAKLLGGVCAAGVCKGELPGCKPNKEEEVIKLPHVSFKLSRAIPWTNRTSARVRDVIAYGMSVLPEAVDMYGDEIKVKASKLEWWKSTTPAPHDDSSRERRLRGDRLVAANAVSESDVFNVRLTQALPYRLDEQLVGALLKRGAWRGIEDGRERELGPVFIQEFRLLPSDEQSQSRTAQLGLSQVHSARSFAVSADEVRAGIAPKSVLVAALAIPSLFALGIFGARRAWRSW